ncbi:hypothetical protein [Haloprofundus halophilus]|uniref:hypothetical protein n=1 Tax=Haloprofundus halophilus TaxID=2283527 RepID=UPI000E4517F3|nr:hypothetical protein [Haloprofundus halophilus]
MGGGAPRGLVRAVADDAVDAFRTGGVGFDDAVDAFRTGGVDAPLDAGATTTTSVATCRNLKCVGG